jgi:hypothetical protein
MRRTYFDHGRVYAFGYRGFYCRGHVYFAYVPAYYYRPAFYGWASRPWAAPVVYSWGWGAAPWYGYYGYYFYHLPVYPAATWWITDYIIGQNLKAAYEAQSPQSANASAAASVPAAEDESTRRPQSADEGGGSPLTIDVKQPIADQVGAQLEAESAVTARPRRHASDGSNSDGGQTSTSSASVYELPAALNSNYRTFIVSSVLSEQAPDGSECSLSAGDVVTRIDDTPDADQTVKVHVSSSSQTGDCASGSQVAMAVDDLQEMHNRFREQLGAALKALAENQGKNGLPSGPAAGGHANPDGQVTPDTDVERQLSDQLKEADAAEAEALQEAGSS